MKERKMRIVIDLQGAQTASRYRGIGRYSLSLAKAMIEQATEHKIFIVLNGEFTDTLESLKADFSSVLSQDRIHVWYPPQLCGEDQSTRAWQKKSAEMIREAFLLSLEPDIIFISSFFEGFSDAAVTSIGLFDSSTPVTLSLYDLIPLLNPDKYLKPHPQFETFYKEKINYLTKASKFLAISDSAKKEVECVFTADLESIVNISSAADPHFKKIEISEEEKKDIYRKFNILNPFVLYTGGADERKNLPRLIRSYAALPLNIRRQSTLVFAGKMPALSVSELTKIAKSSGLKSHEVIFIGYITDRELILLYHLCQLFVFPSWHEGFGLPALEAMACGAPVIAANTTSLPEVVVNTEALFDPFSEENISSLLLKGITDADFRQSLMESGLKQAQNFSWTKSAKIAIQTFDSMKCPISKNKESRQELINRLIASIASYSSQIKPTKGDLTVTASAIAQTFPSPLTSNKQVKEVELL